MGLISVFPVAGSTTICSAFGDPRAGGGTHHGVDICAPMGAPVLAAASGSVRYGQDPMGGNVALVTLPGGQTLYNAHLSAFVGTARQVSAGDVIGLVGMTGNASTTLPHLHFEIWETNSYQSYINPTAELAGAVHYRYQPQKIGIAGVLAVGAGLIAGAYLLGRVILHSSRWAAESRS
jgi:murein DD-endopeptidase MepM/ murein hydrolase activator NlpD